MKKTIKINISGLVFHIDEDAYDKLANYLERLKAKLGGTPGESEIIADIEFRIAEIFQTKISEEKEVISLEDVAYVISVLGEPEEIDGSDEEEDFGPSPGQTNSYRETRKRIYRDPDNKYLGGVCGGLGEYFRIDPLIIRIIFVVFTLVYGVGILIYLLLWVIVPEARTRTEKMEMRGEDINISNIEKSIRKEYEQVKSNVNNFKNSRTYRRDRNVIERFLRGIGKIILVFFKIIGGIIGISFVIAGVAILVAIIGSLIAGHTWFIQDFWDITGFSLTEILSVFVDETVAIVGLIALFALIAIPVLGLIYAGVKLLFPFRAHDKAIGISGVGIWIGALVLLLIFGASEAMKYNTSERISSSEELQMESQSPIYIMGSIMEVGELDQVELNFGYHQDILLTERDKELIVLVRPEVDIVKSFGNKLEVSLRKRARGVNSDAARRQAEDVEYSYLVKDSIILLDSYFELPKNTKWRDQEVDVVISIPVGTLIYLDESLRDMLQGVESVEDLWENMMLGKSWIMTEEGLSLSNKETE